jgi:hypothetical protein
MQTEGYGKPVQTFVRAYLVALFLALIATGTLMIKGLRDWGYGDWLINYQGGFIRRGLMGEICFLLAKPLHMDPIYLVAVIGMTCYFVLFWRVWQLLPASSWRWWVIALLTSPITLAFPVISRTSFRKEILYYAILGTLIVWMRRNGEDRTKDTRLAVALSIASLLLVLSHEPLIEFFFTYGIASLLICLKDPRRVFRILIMPALLCGIAIPFVITHFGSPEAVSKICASIGTPDVATCSQAVRIVAQTKQEALSDVALFTRKYHYYRNYSIAALLALIPIIGAYRELSRQPESRRSLRILLGAACVALPWSFTLFHYGIDWGRWIHMHTMSICLLLLLIDSIRQRDAQAQVEHMAPWKHAFVAVFLVLYATCWSVPGVKDKPRFGYVSLANRIVHWNGSLTN